MYKFLILLFLITGAFAQQFENNRLVVFGDAEASSPADKATFIFEVEGVSASLSEAIKKARKKIAHISEELYSIGLEERNLKTSFFYSGENLGDKAFLSSARDYKTRFTVIVEIDSMPLLEPAIITVSQAQPLSISNINFSLKDTEMHKSKALKQAVLNAKEKALLMTQNMDAQSGKLLFIEEVQQYPIRSNRALYADVHLTEQKRDAAGSSFFPEEIRLTARVKVIIEVANKP